MLFRSLVTASLLAGLSGGAHAAIASGVTVPHLTQPAGRLGEIPEATPIPWIQPLPAVVNDGAIVLHLPSRSWMTPAKVSQETVEAVFGDVYPLLGIESRRGESPVRSLEQGSQSETIEVVSPSGGARPGDGTFPTIVGPTTTPPPASLPPATAATSISAEPSTPAGKESPSVPDLNSPNGKGETVNSVPGPTAPSLAPPNRTTPPAAATPVPSSNSAAVRRPMPPQVRGLREPLERCLKQHEQIRLNTKDDGCWSIMHSFLGWGPTTEIHVGGPRGTRVNAIQWLTQNQPCMGRPLFYLTEDRLRGREGPGFQGHPAQFLAMLAQTGIDSTYPIKVGGRSFTVTDLVSEEQKTCFQDTELTFKLIGLSHYVSTDAEWQNERNETWNFPRIVQIELAQPVNGAACGGTHRLMGLTFSLAKRKREGLAIDGHWWRAQKYIEDYQKYVLTLQNRDGSFSSDWFKKKSDWGDMDRRLQTTGHMLEWLVYSLPDESLYHPQVVSAVNYLTTVLTQHRFHEWEVGPKGHAIRALRLYYTRLFQTSSEAASPVARRGARAGVK